MKISAGTHVGMKRAENQDCYAAGELPDGGVWAVVCDGMGGHAGGNVASSTATESIALNIKSNYREGMKIMSVKNMLESAIVSASADIFSRAEKEPELKGMGTTVAAAVFVGSVAVIAWAGDSRCYLIRGGKITRLTKDHSLVQNLVDSGAITEEEANVHPMKNMITRALGIREDVQVDFNEEEITPGDIFLLCSDGLTNHVSDAEIAEIALADDFSLSADRLIDLANKNGGSDNITAVLIAEN